MEIFPVNTNFKCVLCNVENMTHEAWKHHFSFDKKHAQKCEEIRLKKLYCEKCDVQCNTISQFDRHNKTKKHTGKSQAKAEELFCKTCNKQYRQQTEYDTHLLTNLHKKKCSKVDYNCKCCDYVCETSFLWNQHCKTAKHLASVTASST